MKHSIKQFVYRFYLCILALRNYISDYYNHIRYFVNYHSDDALSRDMLRCKIMLIYHQLEKAQTYPQMRSGYGKDKIFELIRLTDLYYSNYGSDSVFLTSLGVIKSHFENQFSYKDDSLYEKYLAMVHMAGVNIDNLYRGGVIKKSIADIPINDSLLEFLKTRRSLRQFSDIRINESEIKKAVEYAMTAPSACNRQCVRVHYYDNPSVIKEIVLAQKSDVNWCLDAKGLFIITGNRSCFRDYFERNQYMFDAGLFSMNLVLGLHNQHIGSCFKMAQKDTKIDNNTKKIASIPPEEDICVLLLAGKYPENSIYYAKSSRIDMDEVLTVH